MPCPECNSPLPADGSCCDECGWVRPEDSLDEAQSMFAANVGHFLSLAKNGRHGAASGGAQHAHALATVAIEHVPGLDALAAEGFREFCLLVKETPDTARRAAGL